MIDFLNNVKEQYLLACNSGLDFLFIWILIFYLLGNDKLTKQLKNVLIYLVGMFAVTFIMVMIGFDYSSFFWLPTISAMLILFVAVYLKLDKKESKIILTVGLVALMFANTAIEPTISSINPRLNKLGVDKDVITVSDKLNELGATTVLAAQSYEKEAMQCHSITRFLAEPIELIDQNGGAVTQEQMDVVNMVDLSEQYRTDEDDSTSPAEPYLSVAENYGIEYIVLDDACDDSQYMLDNGYEIVAESGEYHAYYMPNQRWVVTEYASESGNQSMIYTLEDLDNHLIIVDGGWEMDKEQLLNVIQRHNNHVDEWIITHPDADHVGAFNAIFSDAECVADITVDEVFFPDIDHDEYAANAKPWDGFADYEKFLSVTKDWKNIIEVKAGDEYKLLDLNVQFFNSYSNKIDGTDAVNDGSLLFKISGRRNSMLFCADVGVTMSQTLIEQWGDQLKSDYLQMGHHGNGGLNEDFYKLVQPSVAFADAPEWLFHPEDGTATYDSEIKTAMMESMGATVYYYATAPNTVIIR